jgi:accessory gene regulator protein AgrB
LWPAVTQKGGSMVSAVFAQLVSIRQFWYMSVRRNANNATHHRIVMTLVASTAFVLTMAIAVTIHDNNEAVLCNFN